MTLPRCNLYWTHPQCCGNAQFPQQFPQHQTRFGSKSFPWNNSLVTFSIEFLPQQGGSLQSDCGHFAGHAPLSMSRRRWRLKSFFFAIWVGPVPSCSYAWDHYPSIEKGHLPEISLTAARCFFCICLLQIGQAGAVSSDQGWQSCFLLMGCSETHLNWCLI